MSKELRNIYYQPENLWIGRKAVTMLRKETKLPLKEVKAWLEKQELWQVHKPPPKRIDHPHYYVTEVSRLHQADLLFLPHDKVYQNTYKYTLNIIDVASRKKAFENEESQQIHEDVQGYLQKGITEISERASRRQRYRVLGKRFETDEKA